MHVVDPFATLPPDLAAAMRKLRAAAERRAERAHDAECDGLLCGDCGGPAKWNGTYWRCQSAWSCGAD